MAQRRKWNFLRFIIAIMFPITCRTMEMSKADDFDPFNLIEDTGIDPDYVPEVTGCSKICSAVELRLRIPQEVQATSEGTYHLLYDSAQSGNAPPSNISLIRSRIHDPLSVEGLLPGVEYTFGLYFTNSTVQNKQLWTATLPTTPDPPTNLTINILGGKVAEASWESPIKGGYSGFKLSLVPLSEKDDNLVRNKYISHVTTPFLLRDLTPGASYEVQLHSVFHGQDSSVFITKNFTTKPNTPGRFIVWFRNETTLLVLWQPPYPSGIFDQYRVSIMPEDAHQSVLFVDKEREPPGPAQAAFYGLVPGRNYNISVQTVSHSQISEPTKAQYRTVPLPPTNVTYDQSRLAPYAFDVRWDPPKTLAEFDRYQVALGIRNTVRYLINKEEERVVTFDEELEPGHTYEVVVKTVSGNVASWPVTANVTTRPLPARIVNSSSSGVGEIWVEWEPSINSTQDSYRIKYSDMETYNSGGSLLVVQNTSINLTSLLPGRNYSISISSVSKRISSESTVIYQVTKPSSPVIEILQPSADAWNISWKSDVTSRQDQYVVVYIRNDTGYLQERTTKNNWLVVDDLYPGARYEIKVYAVSFGFRSEPYSYFQTIAPSSPRNLQVVKTSSSNMILVWMAPLNSLYDHFNVRYRSTGSTFWRELGLVNTTSCEINDLVPGERYAIQVSSVSKKVDSLDPAEVEQTMYPNPIKKVKEILDSYNMTFEWEVPLGLRDYFIIVYNPVSEPHDQQSLQVTANDTKPTEKASIRIEDLKPGDLYSFRFYAVSHNLRSEGIGIQARTRPVIDSVINIVTDEHETKTLGIKYTPTPRRSVVFDRYRFQLGDSSVPAQEKLFNDTNRLVIFDNLVPGHLYNISIWTISSGVNSVPIYRQARLYPEGISSVTALSLSDSEITLKWDRPPGEMDVYEIEYQDHLGLLVKNITFRERNTFTGLRPHHNYTFLITVLSGYDSATTRRSRPLSETFQTLESVPGKVHLFRSVNVKPSEITLKWSLPSSEQHGILTSFKITYYEKGTEKRMHDFFEPSDFEGTIHDLKPGSTYIFEVQANTKVGPGGSILLIDSTPIWAPPVPETSIFPKLVSRTSSTITIGFSRNYFSSSNGQILAYTIIIAEETAKQSNSLNMLSWSDVQQYPQWPPYQVTEPYYPFNGTITEEFIIGSEKCTNVKGFCNGPLKPSSSYKVKIRAFTTSALFTDTVFSYPIQTESDNTTLLAAVLAPIFILIAMVILLLILWQRKLGLFAKKTRHSKSDVISIPESEIVTSRIIKLRDFADHYRLMSADSDFRFSEEFELLKHVGKDRSCSAADLPVNRPKNRFTNILPYDHSRIKLLPTDDEEGTDYINANYIPGYNSPREFIVTQGPLHSTRDDFWRMVWEQNCRAIVMLTRCIEKGREKCDHYWPFDMQPVFYGDIQVTLLNESQYSHWTIAEFKVCRGDQSRVVKHFHFTTWPDFGVPEPPQVLVKFVRTFRERVGTDPKPIIVHCSAGVGRSGTFIALDRLMQHIQKQDYVDPFGIVYEMRKERVWMVQNEQQYICIHQCLLCVLEKKEDMVDIPRPEAHDNQGYDGTLCPVVRNGVCKSELLETNSVNGNKTNC